MNLPCPLIASDSGSGVRLAGRPNKAGSRMQTLAHTHTFKVRKRKETTVYVNRGCVFT